MNFLHEKFIEFRVGGRITNGVDGQPELDLAMNAIPPPVTLFDYYFFDKIRVLALYDLGIL